MIKKWIFSVAILFLFSCKKEQKLTESKIVPKKESKISSENNTSTTKDLKLETFGFPQEIEGCSCYFATDREQFVKQNYIYVDDYQKSGFIKINGKQIQLEYDKKNEVLPEKTLNINLQNDDYSIRLKGEVIEEGEIETALYKGVLKVENHNGQKIEIPVYGECGC